MLFDECNKFWNFYWHPKHPKYADYAWANQQHLKKKPTQKNGSRRRISKKPQIDRATYNQNTSRIMRIVLYSNPTNPSFLTNHILAQLN